MPKEHRLVITYDITDNKLRTRIHKFLSQYGVNSQKSVFEIIAGDIEVRKIVTFINDHVPQDENDTARIYDLCKSCQKNISCLGAGLELNRLDYQIV